MKFGINSDHVSLWKRYALSWIFFVLCLVVLGWAKGPRVDEVIFVLLLPVPILVAYVLFCLIAVGVKSLLPKRDHRRCWRRPLLRRLPGNNRLGHDS